MSRILVIEDDASIRSLAMRILISAGHEAIGATDGRDGVALWKENGADLIVTDLRMAGMNGIDVIREIGRVEPDLPIIVISGDAGAQLGPLAEVMSSQPVKILRKPFRANELIALVTEVLGGG
jgi:two-component system cell cycle sensor histidine kinase/response regulator CckA